MTTPPRPTSLDDLSIQLDAMRIHLDAMTDLVDQWRTAMAPAPIPVAHDVDVPVLVTSVLDAVGASWPRLIQVGLLRSRYAADCSDSMITAGRMKTELGRIFGTAVPEPVRGGRHVGYQPIELWAMVNGWYHEHNVPLPWARWLVWSSMRGWLHQVHLITQAAEHTDGERIKDSVRIVRRLGGSVPATEESIVGRAVRATARGWWPWMPTTAVVRGGAVVAASTAV